MLRHPVKCAHCQFWDLAVQSGSAERDTTGRCTLRAPTAVDDRTGLAMWPITEQDDRCFEGEIDHAKVAEDTPSDIPF